MTHATKNTVVFALVSALAPLVGCLNSPQRSKDPVKSDPTASTQLVGSFVPKAHQGMGNARIEQSAEGSTRLLFEADFLVDNGPALYVYLSKSTSADAHGHANEALNLGNLKGVMGEQEYAIPLDTDLSAYRSAMVWCKDFGVLFTIADLSPPEMKNAEDLP